MKLRQIYRNLKRSNYYAIMALNFFVQRVFGVNREVRLSVHFTTQISCAKKINFQGGERLKKSLAFSGNCYFSGYNGIVFGHNVLFAPGVKIISSNHAFSESRLPLKSGPVVIEDNVWLGANCVILPGICIGKNSVVGAGAVVTKNVLENSIVAGNPARIIGLLCTCGAKVFETIESNARQCSKCRAKNGE